jgi:integrase
MRFHDLRGTTATLLARAGVGLVVAQRILRHSDPRLTANMYSHVDLADLQAGDRLRATSSLHTPRLRRPPGGLISRAFRD